VGTLILADWARLGLAQGVLPLQAWAGAYRGGCRLHLATISIIIIIIIIDRSTSQMENVKVAETKKNLTPHGLDMDTVCN